MFENKIKPIAVFESQEKADKTLENEKLNVHDGKKLPKENSKLFKAGNIFYLILLIVFIIFMIVITTGVVLTGISKFTIRWPLNFYEICN